MGTRAEYATKPREQISQILRDEPRFLSAAEIHRRLDLSHAKVSLSTVYRTLDHLLAKGAVTSRVDAEGEASFMHCEPLRHHHHAICGKCGRVEDVDCAAAEQFAETLRETHGFQLDDHAMEFFGRCRGCR
jgi:Fur family ferric uptake transcriptional regulator